MTTLRDLEQLRDELIKAGRRVHNQLLDEQRRRFDALNLDPKPFLDAEGLRYISHELAPGRHETCPSLRLRVAIQWPAMPTEANARAAAYQDMYERNTRAEGAIIATLTQLDPELAQALYVVVR